MQDSAFKVNWLLVPGAIALAFLALAIVNNPIFTSTDLPTWISDYSKVIACISENILYCESISKFPVAYIFNSALISFLKTIYSDERISILIINIVFLVLPIVYFVLNKLNLVAKYVVIIYAVFILLSPVPAFYTYSGALELQSGVVVGLFVSALLSAIKSEDRHGGRINALFLFGAAIMFPLYKDTNLINVGASLAVAAGVGFVFRGAAKWNGAFVRTTNVLPAVIGLFIAGVIIVLFNIARYRSIFPEYYFSEAKATSPDFFRSLEFLLFSILSPNGGVFAFWSLSFVFVFGALRSLNLVSSPFAIIFSVVFVGASVVGMAMWWAPFGWDAWGDRLAVPAALAAMIVILSTVDVRNSADADWFGIRASALRFVRQSSIKWFAQALVVFLTAVSFYYVAVGYFGNRQDIFNKSLFGGEACKTMKVALEGDPGKIGLAFWRSDYYYNCASERFRHIPVLGE